MINIQKKTDNQKNLTQYLFNTINISIALLSQGILLKELLVLILNITGIDNVI